MADFSLMGDYIPPAERSLGGRTPEQFFDDIGRADYVALRESDLNWFPPRMRPALVAKLNSLEPVSVTHHFGQFGGEGMQSDDLIIVRRRSMPREILRR